MKLVHVHIEGFRGLPPIDLRFDGPARSFAAVVGPNGSGKTSVLEAVSDGLLYATLGEASTLPRSLLLAFDEVEWRVTDDSVHAALNLPPDRPGLLGLDGWFERHHVRFRCFPHADRPPGFAIQARGTAG